MKRLALLALLALHFSPARAAKIFVPMDAENQTAHLKAYGVAYNALQLGIGVDWLLNYQGGSFSIDHSDALERLLKLRGVSY